MKMGERQHLQIYLLNKCQVQSIVLSYVRVLKINQITLPSRRQKGRSVTLRLIRE